MKQNLSPSIDDLRLECVLMQAWKKTSAYLRAHSWYADTLGLDYESLRLPQFIRDIQERLQDPEKWKPKPLELVPAPKNQRWAYQNEKWVPLREEKIDLKLRPLAHLDLQDQVVATAIMLCLANRVETAMGSPRLPVNKAENRRQILAYGHRLFCDQSDNGELHHRWGSTKLYRQYFKDYQTFLERPKIVAKPLTEKYAGCLADDIEYEVAIIQSDLSKFYDRVRPELLRGKLSKFQQTPEEDAFFRLAGRVFDWRWSDQCRADRYAKDHNIDNFRSVALPQGLVTAGFFANVVLYDFETALREAMGHALPGSDLILEDICYYVDDFRIVLRIPKGMQELDVKAQMITGFQSLLDRHASGLKISENKTLVTIEGRDKRFLVMQSREANRIQSQVSDTFDMLHGTELIAAIEGFFHTQQRYSTEPSPDKKKDSGLLVGVPDMRDDTAARFAAGKFRRTFRSLRPLLADEPEWCRREPDSLPGNDEEELPHFFVLTKMQLDERAKFFAALLIEEWIRNPGNVRLLRIALDMYPDCEFLDQVLGILRPGWEPNSFRKAKREVRVYCLAELFRAGATETGFVQDNECLPSGISIIEYHNRLIKEAIDILTNYLDANAPGARFPWYLMQQVLLYLLARNALPEHMTKKTRGGKFLSHYWMLAKFMAGKIPANLEQRSIYLVIAKTGYGISDFNYLRSMARLSDKFLINVNRISPSVARYLWLNFKSNASERLARTALRLGLENHAATATEKTIAVLSELSINPFIEEENLLQLASWLLKNPASSENEVTPWHVRCDVSTSDGYVFGKIDTKSFEFTKAGGKATHLFKPSDWCETDEERRKLQIGLLLRYALRGSTDFYNNVSLRKISHGLRYKKPISHWEQQRYSSYQGRNAFGPPWLPISSFTEDLLFQLLRWPGAGILSPEVSIDELSQRTEKRLAHLLNQRGKITAVTFLEQKAPYPTIKSKHPWERTLRIGIVQSIIPSFDDYKQNTNNPELLSDASLRTRQRAHLASIMEGVAQMLRVRETHRPQTRDDGKTLDLLIFPELAIHPHDIDPLILPFVRRHKCLMLFGQVYHPKDTSPDAPLINSCLWMVPEWSRAQGFQIRRIEQGKLNLTAAESEFIPKPVGFRPAQWLIEYQWHSDAEKNRPLILSASICYDATDIELAADLRSKSDLYIICALNRDVGTFDRMSEGLHYHMFQGIIVVNNGQYGGSSFYMPFSEPFHRQVFHVHGQPQVSIAFAEVSPQKLIDRHVGREDDPPEGQWKTPPAGWEKNRP
ncbi:hypothetical protein ER57_17920 [Smithella sp. SCADC]|jgi:hypothetical protein|nr:hypothetical protein ER57_17920 [Smithella sp. SCADC]